MKQCPHCQPYKASTHLPNKVFFWVSFFGEKLLGLLPQRVRNTTSNFLDRVWVWILQLLRIVGIVKFDKNPNRSGLRNRGLVFFDAGRDAGVDVRAVSFFDRPSGEYTYIKNGQRVVYQEIPEMNPQNSQRVDDKVESKKMFATHNFPHPTGQAFFSASRGLAYGQELGFPLAVKPVNGSLSKHVTTNIKTKEKLVDAIAIAKQYSSRFLVEQFIDGQLYRATVLGSKKVFVCQKRLANVVGDGSRSIRKLITEKNSNPSRGGDEKNTTLHKISVPDAKKHLEQNDLPLEYTPENGERVYLSDLYTLKAGCDIIEVTENTHPETKTMLRRAAKAFGVGLVGFDLLAQDITKSYKEQECALLEANSLPYADMHRFPSEGTPQQIGKAAWKIIKEEK